MRESGVLTGSFVHSDTHVYIVQLILILTVIMFYKVTVNTELVNPVPLLQGLYRIGSCKPLITAFSSAKQQITLFYVHFCLKSPYLIYIGNSLRLHSQPNTYIIHYILRKAHHSFLELKTLNSTLKLHLGAIRNSKMTVKMHKNAKITVLHRLQKNEFALSAETRQRRPYSASAVNVYIKLFILFAILHIDMTTDVSQVLISDYI